MSLREGTTQELDGVMWSIWKIGWAESDTSKKRGSEGEKAEKAIVTEVSEHEERVGEATNNDFH